MKHDPFQYIRDTYQVPAKKGQRVKYTGNREPQEGVIVGTTGAHITIKFDGETKNKGPYHPTWEMEYLEK